MNLDHTSSFRRHANGLFRPTWTPIAGPGTNVSQWLCWKQLEKYWAVMNWPQCPSSSRISWYQVYCHCGSYAVNRLVFTFGMLAEVTFRADKNGQWLPVSEWQDGPGTKTQQQRFAILVGTRNHIGAHRNNPPPTGPFRFKVRQLKLLGYRVDVVPFHLFMLVSDEKRLDLVLNLIKRLR